MKRFSLVVVVTEIRESTTSVLAETLEEAKDEAERRARSGELLYNPAPVTSIEVEEAP